MTQKGGSRKLDRRRLGVVEISPEFTRIDLLRSALIRDSSREATANDKRLIRQAELDGYNLDEIGALQPGDMERYLKTLETRRPQHPRDRKKGNSVSIEQKPTQRLPHTETTSPIQIGDESDFAQVTQSGEVVSNGGGEGTPAEAIETLEGIAREQHTPVSESSPDVTIYSLSPEGHFKSHGDTSVGSQSIESNNSPKRPRFGRPATPSISYYGDKPKRAFELDIFKPAPDAEDKPFVLKVADFVRQDTGVVIHFGESTGFPNEGQEREFIGRIFVVGPESRVRGERG